MPLGNSLVMPFDGNFFFHQTEQFVVIRRISYCVIPICFSLHGKDVGNKVYASLTSLHIASRIGLATLFVYL